MTWLVLRVRLSDWASDRLAPTSSSCSTTLRDYSLIKGARMRAGDRRLCFEFLEQRKVLAGEIVSESFSDSSMPPTAAEFAENLNGVRAAEVRLQYDPTTVTPDLSTIKAGDAWNGQAAVVANVDEVAGTLVAFLFTTQPISGQGNLLELEFKSAEAGQAVSNSPAIGIEQVRLNEGQIELSADMTVLSPPSRATDDAIPESDAEWANDLALTELVSTETDVITQDRSGVPADHHPIGRKSMQVASDVDTGEDEFEKSRLRLDDLAATSKDNPPVHHRLHDMRVTNVFIGPLLPDFGGLELGDANS